MLSTPLLALAGRCEKSWGNRRFLGMGRAIHSTSRRRCPRWETKGAHSCWTRAAEALAPAGRQGRPHRVVVPWGRWVVGGGQRARRAPLPHGKRARFNWAGGRSAGPAAGRRTQALLSPLSLPAPAGAGRARSGAATESRARHRGKQPNPPRLLGLSQALAAREEASRWPARLPG